jgi:hypothetical protein
MQIIEWKARGGGLAATPKVARNPIVANPESLNGINQNNKLLVWKPVTNTGAHPFHLSKPYQRTRKMSSV